jgi:hypothetical protein
MTVVGPRIYKTYIQVKENKLNSIKTKIGKIGRKGIHSKVEEI